ncbi:unnamed protein product [Schistosoma guineensis]|nr:unnamed protein product [Schistosoma guineensis]
MSQLKLDHYGKPGRPFRPSMEPGRLRYQLIEDNGVWWRNFVDWLKLDVNTVGCRLSDLVVKCSRAGPVGPGFESRRGRGRGCALLRSPIQGRNGCLMLSGFPCWSSFN